MSNVIIFLEKCYVMWHLTTTSSVMDEKDMGVLELATT